VETVQVALELLSEAIRSEMPMHSVKNQRAYFDANLF